MSAFLKAGQKALIGMVHLPALPGSTTYDGTPFEQVVEGAVADARALAHAGFDAVMIQNTHDLPSSAVAPVETAAFLTVVGREIRRQVGVPLAVNVLKNDAASALAVAAATGAAFVRVKVYVGAVVDAEGVIEAAASAALRTRQRLGTETEIWADVLDRTSHPLVPQGVDQVAEWAIKFGRAAAVIVTGSSFQETLGLVDATRQACPGISVAIGGGVTQANVSQAMAAADALIVGSALEERPFTGPISAVKAADLVAAARTR